MKILALILILAVQAASPTIADAQEITMVFAGDAMQHKSQLTAAHRSDGSYNYDAYFARLKPYIEAADYAVVNLETPVAGAPYSGYPCFNAPESYLLALKEAGFDFVLAANNHTLDRRDRGVVRTIEAFERYSVPYAGIYRNKAEREKRNPVIRDINGIKVAFLNYTYGTNGITIQKDVVVDYINRNVIAADIKKARDAGADIIAVFPHWGVEYKLLPEKSQKQLADWLIDQGVDLIIGGHPHVIQPMEIHRSEKYDKDVFLVYSLGNFISGMKKTDTQGGAMARVTIARDSTGTARVRNADYRLVFTQKPTRAGQNFMLLPAEETPEGTQNRTTRDAFVRNATRVFDRYNVGVPRDSSPIK